MFFFTKIELDETNSLRLVYAFLIFTNLIYLYIIEYDIIMSIVMPLFNVNFLLIGKYKGVYGSYAVYPESIFILMYYLSIFFVKRNDYYNRKLVFLKSLKNKNYMDYTKNLIDVINNMIISMTEKEVLFINNFTEKYLKYNK